jgi:hypothetical protein
MPRIAFLFGAGASYGAGDILPRCPPLGKDLYAELGHAFPDTWGNLPDNLPRSFERDFESGMEALWRREGQDQSQPLMEIARYFAGFHPGPSEPSCYLQLIRLLASCHLIGTCGFATLNYDCLMDLDLHSAKFGYSDGHRRGPFYHRESVRLWKLHGACNVLPDLGTNRVIDSRFVAMGGQIYDGPVRYATPSQVIAFCDDNGIPPMLSLYAPGKPTPVAARAVEQIRQKWEAWLKQSDVIVVIGARVLPRDDHIYRPLKKARGQIWYVGNRRDFHPTRRFEWFGERFDKALDGELRKRLPSLARR